MHIHKNPLLLGTLPADLEGGLDVGVEMNLRASQIVHDARQEFAGRESYPSSQLRFKAENGRALDGGDIYLRDEKDQVTCQPSTVVVRPAIVFGHGHLSEEVGEF
jgi:hypothetical protein